MGSRGDKGCLQGTCHRSPGPAGPWPGASPGRSPGQHADLRPLTLGSRRPPHLTGFQPGGLTPMRAEPAVPWVPPPPRPPVHQTGPGLSDSQVHPEGWFLLSLKGKPAPLFLKPQSRGSAGHRGGAGASGLGRWCREEAGGRRHSRRGPAGRFRLGAEVSRSLGEAGSPPRAGGSHPSRCHS